MLEIFLSWSSRNRTTLAWTTHALPTTSNETGAKKLISALILHQQPFSTRASSITLAQMTWDSFPDRGPGTPSLSLITALCLT